MRSLRPVRAASLAAAVALALASCGVRYYSATVFGYVREASVAADGTQAGINGAEVLVFLEDPTGNPDARPSVRTSTMTSGNQPGYWSHKIMWSTSRPAFADEGDSGTVWLTIMRSGYFPKTAKATGILSDASNAVPTIELERIAAAEVKGRVVNENGVGVNGVRVVLDLATTEEKSDYAATTATDEEGVVGVYVFSDVAWQEADSVPPESRAIVDGVASESIRIYVDDTAWYSDTNDPRYPERQTALSISTDARTDLTASPITARSATFVLPILKGRVTSVESPTAGISGVTIAIDFPLTTARPDATVVSATLGSEAGWYQFENLSWTNNRPNHSAEGVYDDVISAQVYLDDGNWYSANDADAPIELTVTSGTTEVADSPIPVGDARFSVPTVTGRVLLEGTATYENGVAVRLELAASGTVIGTTTSRVGSDDGVFQFRDVTWIDAKPERASGGAILETEQARLYVQDPDYGSDTDAQSPIIIELAAGAAYSLSSPVAVSRRNFSAPKVTGSVVTDTTSAGIAGITVVLDLQSTPGNTRDFTVTTDVNGDFVFNNVRWTDDTPDSAAADTEEVALTIEDTNYETVQALSLATLTSDQEAGAAGDPAWTIVASRLTRWTYSVNVTGVCAYRASPTDPSLDVTVGGVTVTISSTDAQGGGLQTNATPVVVQTGANGNYSATIDWSRDPDYTPAPEAASNGGDTLAVSVAFSHPTYDFGAALSTSVLSWSQNNIVNGLSTAVNP